MRVELRRFRDVTNVVLIVESREEAAILDALGDQEIDHPQNPDSVIFARGEYEVRLSTDFADHYVLLKGNK